MNKAGQYAGSFVFPLMKQIDAEKNKINPKIAKIDLDCLVTSWI
jgi:hypothetical protein